MSDPITTADAVTLQTGPSPRASVIVLHGLGADGHDFVPVAQSFRLPGLGDLRFVFPHAPVMPVTINGGRPMRAWYDIRGADLAQREDDAGLRRSQARVDALIAAEVGRGVPAARIVLAGFSQGAAMTLLTGMRHPARLAGLAALSGYLPLAALTAAERHSANADVPIFMAHGRSDPIVPHGRGVASRDALLALDCDVEWHEYPMGHSVCPEEVTDLEAFLARVLS